MHAFEVAAIVDQRRATREREARLERMRRADSPPPPAPAVEPVVVGTCSAGHAGCGHPAAA